MTSTFRTKVEQTRMNSILIVGIGGFVGAILRYLLSTCMQNGGETFPYSTLAVNVIGSFLLSLVMFTSEYTGIFPDDTRLFLTVGLLGAFTTMSTFSYETFKFFEMGKIIMLTKYVVGTIVFTLLAVYLSKIIVVTMMGTK